MISSAASQAPAEANDVTLAEMDEAIAKLQLWRINRAKETCESLNGLVPTRRSFNDPATVEREEWSSRHRHGHCHRLGPAGLDRGAASAEEAEAMPPQQDNHNEDEDKDKDEDDEEVGPEEDDAAEQAGPPAGRAAAAQAVTRISSISASITF